MFSINAKKILADPDFQASQIEREYLVDNSTASKLGISFSDLQMAVQELLILKKAEYGFDLDAIKKF